MRTHVNLTRVTEVETMRGWSHVNVKVDPRSTFTFTRGLSCIACISFTQVNFTCGRKEKLRDNGNQPLLLTCHYPVLQADVKFTCVNKMEAMYEGPRVNVKVERGSTFTFTCIVSISLTRVKFTCVRT